MKISLSILAIFCMQFACLASVTYTPTLTATPPVIDGDLTDGWQDAYSFNMVYPDIVNNGGTLRGDIPFSAAELSADVYMQWDLNNLYFAVRVYDESLVFLQDQPGPYNEQDVVQIAFQPVDGMKGIYDFAISDANDVVGPYLYSRTAYSLSNSQLAGTLLSDGYIIEAALPWSDFGGYQPQLGDSHLMGFILVDYNYGFYSTTMFDYGNNDQTGINDESGWNNIILLGENDCGLWGLPAGDMNMDCRVNLTDFALIATDWLKCTNPSDTDCIDLR